MPFPDRGQRPILKDMTDPQLTETDDHVVERPFTSPKRILITAVTLLVMAGVIYTAWWHWLASEVRDHVDGWVNAMRLDGRDAAYGTLTVAGFPGDLIIDIDRIDAADPDGGWRVQVPGLHGLLSPWTIDRLQGAFTGPLRLELTQGAAPGVYTVSSDNNLVNIDRDSGGRVRADLAGVRAMREGVPDPLTAETVSLLLVRGSNPVYGQATIDLRKVDLPPEMHSAFGGHVAYLKVVMEATGAEVPEGINAESLRRWAGDGGAVDIKSLDVRHGVLGMAGEGTMALDGDLQPIGAFTAQISGFNAAIDALVAAGAAREQDGALAKVVLGVLAKSPPGGGPKIVSLPLSLQDRTLSVGPVPLVRLRPIEWDQN